MAEWTEVNHWIVTVYCRYSIAELSLIRSSEIVAIKSLPLPLPWMSASLTNNWKMKGGPSLSCRRKSKTIRYLNHKDINVRSETNGRIVRRFTDVRKYFSVIVLSKYGMRCLVTLILCVLTLLSADLLVLI